MSSFAQTLEDKYISLRLLVLARSVSTITVSSVPLGATTCNQQICRVSMVFTNTATLILQIEMRIMHMPSEGTTFDIISRDIGQTKITHLIPLSAYLQFLNHRHNTSQMYKKRRLGVRRLILRIKILPAKCVVGSTRDGRVEAEIRATWVRSSPISLQFLDIIVRLSSTTV